MKPGLQSGHGLMMISVCLSPDITQTAIFEEIPLVQGKEQQLHFVGVAMKRYHVQGKRNPSKTVGVARGHQRADTLKPYSQKTSQSNHIRTTALSNSMKQPCQWGNQRQEGHGGEV